MRIEDIEKVKLLAKELKVVEKLLGDEVLAIKSGVPYGSSARLLIASDQSESEIYFIVKQALSEHKNFLSNALKKMGVEA